MGQKRRLQRSLRRKENKKRTPAFKRSNSKNNLPQFVVRAHAAVGAGQVKEANRLFKENAAKVTEEVTGKNPLRTSVMFVLAEVLCLNGKYKMAEELCRNILKIGLQALIYSPALVYNMLGGICASTGRLSEAIINLRKTTELAPDFTGAWSNLGMALVRMGETQEGVSLLQKAARKMDRNTTLGSNFLLYLNYLPNVDQQVFFDEHKRWAEVYAPISRAQTSHNNVPEPDRRLRIGYISPDFSRSSVAYFFESLLDGHDNEAVEVYGYGSVKSPDQTTERLKQKFDCYRDICGVGDETAARMIEQDRIDILVDLAGHTNSNRLPVLIYKPAPIQVAYLGYPNTTGMQAIDYRFTDSLAETPESQEFYTEELIFLPEGFLCYRPPDFAPSVAPLPAVQKGYVTFGSFNNNCKVSPLIMELWVKILKANGSFRFLLKFQGGDDQGLKNRYFRGFEQLGIPHERVGIYGWKSPVEHLQLYEEVDIALDTYPYHGTTTTCEALWMGVPTVSLVGKCHASRVGLSILSRVGLESFATSTPQEYVAKATSLAEDLEGLAKIRASMREQMAASVLCDAKGFACNVEAAYRRMWHQWCRCREAVFR
jgi:predicted O-linked N-acetylglucosamine transferase (SPINDLY family)